MKNILQKLFTWTKKLVLWSLVASVALVILYRFIPIYYSPYMAIRFVQQLVLEDKVIFKKQWTSIGNISSNVPKAVMASEDQLFLEHWGFDFESIQKAWENNQKKRNKIKGGSTISQQVAKNAFLWHGRSYFRKALEAYFTLLIEVFWNKKRIMEVYLNIAEMGNGVYGIEAASKYYFNKSSKRLSSSEAALIAAILPNPRKWSASKPSNYILKRKKWILRNSNNMVWSLEK